MQSVIITPAQFDLSAIDASKLAELTVQELTDLRAALDAEIVSRVAIEENATPTPPTYTLSWEGSSDPRKGKPYLARIVGVSDGKIDRDFVNLPTAYGKKEVVVGGTFMGTEGEILEGREGGSWKNEYRYFYVVRAGKMVNFADATKADAKMNVMKYMLGQLTLEELTGEK